MFCFSDPGKLHESTDLFVIFALLVVLVLFVLNSLLP